MFRYIATAAIALTGVAHLIIAPGHFSHAFPHGVFFILIGTAQLLWSLTFWRYSPPILYWAGLAVSGGTINIWILTQLISVPFALPADVIDPLAVVVIGSELVGFVALVGLMGRGQLAAYYGQSIARLVEGIPAPGPTPNLEAMIIAAVGALVIAWVYGIGVWGGGHLAEVMLPGLGTHDQAHGVVKRPPATSTPDRTLDLEAMIAAAVEAALSAQSTPAPTSGKDSDIQGMIAAAVEAALPAQPTSASEPVPVGAPASARSGGNPLAFFGVLVIIAAIGVWPLALAYRAAGRDNGAIGLQWETLKTLEQVLGPDPDHPDNLTGRHNLAEADLAAGRHDEDVELHEETLKTLERVLGPAGDT